ncbi:MAG: LptF/LptG family permease [Nitrospirota bacterium]|jgi:lipopolysaccharide export system permease protein
MKLIQRHYIREFAKLFALLALGLSATFSLFSLLQRLNDFMPHEPSLGSLVLYTALKVPQNALSLMPVACLLCSLYTMANASRSREIVALMAAGGRVKRLLRPFLWAGLLLSLLSFVMGEFVVPPAIIKAREVQDRLSGVAEEASALVRNGVLWSRAKDGSIIRVEYYFPEGDVYGGVEIYRFGGGVIDEIVKARTATWDEGRESWHFGGVRRYLPGEGAWETLEGYDYEGLGPPDLLRESARKPYEMGIADLYSYLKRLREAGFKNVRLSVDLNSKVSYPFINLIMVLIGVSFPVRRRMSGFVATAIGLLISLAYWFGYTMSLSIGYAGLLPPLAAAWLMPVVAGSAGAWLYWKIPE